MTLRQRQETIDSLREAMESRDQFRVERELLEKNRKLNKKVSKYRKREYQLKTQLNAEKTKLVQRTKSNNGVSELNDIMLDLNMKKKELMRNVDESEPSKGFNGRSASQKK